MSILENLGDEIRNSLHGFGIYDADYYSEDENGVDSLDVPLESGKILEIRPDGNGGFHMKHPDADVPTPLTGDEKEMLRAVQMELAYRGEELTIFDDEAADKEIADEKARIDAEDAAKAAPKLDAVDEPAAGTPKVGDDGDGISR